MPYYRWLALPLIALAALVSPSPEPSSADDLLHIKSNVVYDVRPDTGPTRVSWYVTFADNDPATERRESGTIAFYNSVALPILRGAAALSARSFSGDPLDVTLEEQSQSPLAVATIEFDKRVFYKETYTFTLAYELSGVRLPSLLVTPNYVYLPVVAVGDEAAVTVNTPTDAAWVSDLEPGDCVQAGSTFACSGSESVYIAALAEVTRPDATAAISFETPLKERVVPVSLTYFKGEDAVAQHLKDLVASGLPIIEDLYGFPYPGPPSVRVAQGGRQAVLGYEGLTTCDAATSCDVIVSPIADDITILHEMAHLWSQIYAKRWLSEGLAQIIAEEAAGRLPPGFVQGQPPVRAASGADLQLDEWGDVTSIIGADQSELEIEDAGYDRSLRFMYILRHDLSLETLRQVNAAIAAGGEPADSGRYLDLLEDTSGIAVDHLFQEWVYPSSFAPTLALRREVRDRLAAVELQATAEGLSPDIPAEIREDVNAWRFDEALAALSEAEADLLDYFDLKNDLAELSGAAEAAGLSVPAAISEAMMRWEFGRAGGMIEEAGRALDAYTVARDKVNAGRTVWEGFGLLGNDPEGDLHAAAAAFETADFESALKNATDAADTIDGASSVAFRRLLILAAVLAVFAIGIAVAVWASQRQGREFAEP
jgi:hypothetical protein